MADAAASCGIEPGAPGDVYTPVTPLTPDAPLRLDRASVAFLGDWYGFAASVLEELRATSGSDADPSRVQLWPEHLDMAVDLGAEAAGARGTFGASPGDHDHAQPYLYVTHWGAAPDDAFWNDEHFAGASLAFAALAGAPDQRAAAVEFYRRGRAVLDGQARV